MSLPVRMRASRLCGWMLTFVLSRITSPLPRISWRLLRHKVAKKNPTVQDTLTKKPFKKLVIAELSKGDKDGAAEYKRLEKLSLPRQAAIENSFTASLIFTARTTRRTERFGLSRGRATCWAS